MTRTITRKQIGLYLAAFSQAEIDAQETELKEKISPELFNLLKEQENTVISELATGKETWTFEIPDELVPEWLNIENIEETEEEEDEDGEEQ